MRFAAIMPNDFLDGEGICVSLWMQGCPLRCKGCHNEELWDENGGTEIAKEELIAKIFECITANGITRNFSVLGGEPLSDRNFNDTKEIIHAVREKFPEIKIFLWTGYTDDFLALAYQEKYAELIQDIDVLIDGPYKEELRDITLTLRGSANQKIYRKGTTHGNKI